LFADPLPDGMWDLFARLLMAVGSYARDHIDNALSCFDNMISRAPDAFLQRGYLEPLFNLWKNALLDPNYPEPEAGTACQLMEIVLFYCKPKIHFLIPVIMELALYRIPTAKGESLQTLLFALIVNCFCYDPTLALQIAVEKGWLHVIFSTWLERIPGFPRFHDKKMSMVALSGLLRVPLPDSLKAGLPVLVTALVKLTNDYVAAQTLAEQHADDSSSESDDQPSAGDGDEDEGEHLPDDQDVGAEDVRPGVAESQELKMMAMAAREARLQMEDAGLEDEDDFTTPFDHLEETDLLLGALRELQAREPALAAQIFAALTPDVKAMLGHLQAVNAQRVQAAAEEAAAEAAAAGTPS
jgi:hypothetical protein